MPRGEFRTNTRESGEPPKEVRLCFVFRSDQLAGAEAWIPEAIDRVLRPGNGELHMQWGVKARRVDTFAVGGRPALREPEDTWFQVTPEARRFSSHTTADFPAKLLMAVRKWGTSTYYLDLTGRNIENWTQRRQENTRVLLDRLKDLVLFEPVLLQGEWIPIPELTKDWPAIKARVLAAHETNLAELREMYPDHWALVSSSGYPEWPHPLVGYPGAEVFGVYPSVAEAEEAAVKYRGQCFILNIATGAFWGRWAER
jgi:hypothetical protein